MNSNPAASRTCTLPKPRPGSEQSGWMEIRVAVPRASLSRGKHVPLWVRDRLYPPGKSHDG